MAALCLSWQSSSHSHWSQGREISRSAFKILRLHFLGIFTPWSHLSFSQPICGVIRWQSKAVAALGAFRWPALTGAKPTNATFPNILFCPLFSQWDTQFGVATVLVILWLTMLCIGNKILGNVFRNILIFDGHWAKQLSVANCTFSIFETIFPQSYLAVTSIIVRPANAIWQLTRLFAKNSHNTFAYCREVHSLQLLTCLISDDYPLLYYHHDTMMVPAN